MLMSRNYNLVKPASKNVRDKWDVLAINIRNWMSLLSLEQHKAIRFTHDEG